MNINNKKVLDDYIDARIVKSLSNDAAVRISLESYIKHIVTNNADIRCTLNKAIEHEVLTNKEIFNQISTAIRSNNFRNSLYGRVWLHVDTNSKIYTVLGVLTAAIAILAQHT